MSTKQTGMDLEYIPSIHVDRELIRQVVNELVRAALLINAGLESRTATQVFAWTVLRNQVTASPSDQDTELDLVNKMSAVLARDFLGISTASLSPTTQSHCVTESRSDLDIPGMGDALRADAKKLSDLSAGCVAADAPEDDGFCDTAERCECRRDHERLTAPRTWERLFLMARVANHYELYLKDNDVYLGDIIAGDDGYYTFWPDPQSHGYWEALILTSIGELLNELNADWDRQVQSDPAIGG